MRSLSTTLLGMLSLPAAIRAAPLKPRQTSRADYISNANAATKVLGDKWFHAETGLWDDLWWQSANALTSMSDLAIVDTTFMDTAISIFENVYTNAPANNPTNAGSWLNDFYDDEGWWAIAFIKAYDVTGNDTYLSTAKDIFEDLLTGLNATCGGQWWDKPHSQNNAINNELFIHVAAALGNRVTDNQHYYCQYAEDHANWFLNAGLLSENNTFHDGFTLSDCSVEGTVFSYNQGVILSALVELSALTGNSSWLDSATKVADGAVKTLVDSNGIFTETGSYPTNDLVADQFKGVFARGLADLQKVRGDDSYVTLLTKSADSIWQNDKDDNGFLGPDWQGPVYKTSAPAQSSALDCLIAAAAVSS
ncbi:hypothetical protein LTR15_010148 [Elasticomyces elasticus]|nr:hypothetical protein LTR15_010148 [Elasticomyces elasticus]